MDVEPYRVKLLLLMWIFIRDIGFYTGIIKQVLRGH